MSGDQPPPPGWGAPPPREPEQPAGGQQPPPGSPGWGQPAAPPSWGEFHPAAPPGQPAYPGYPPQGYPPQGHAPQGYPGRPAYPGQVPPYAAPPLVAHKPGAIPLRPLVLTDIFDGAFRIIRYNPQATIGAAVLVSAVAMIVPVVISLVTGSTGGLEVDPTTGAVSDTQLVHLLVGIGGLLVGSQLQAVGLLYVSGMIAHVCSAAAVGRKLSMKEAWAATAGKRWRLLGMSFLLGLAVLAAFALAGLVLLVGVVAFDAPLGAVVVTGLGLGLLLVVGYLWFWVRVRALAVPTLMLEPVGVFGALQRAVRLTRGQFWRLLGLLLLVTLVVGVAGSVLRLPFSLVAQVALTSDPGGNGLLVYLLVTGVATVISAAIVQPFMAAVSALLYVDQRIRKEAYDVELLGRAGFLPV